MTSVVEVLSGTRRAARARPAVQVDDGEPIRVADLFEVQDAPVPTSSCPLANGNGTALFTRQVCPRQRRVRSARADRWLERIEVGSPMERGGRIPESFAWAERRRPTTAPNRRVHRLRACSVSATAADHPRNSRADDRAFKGAAARDGSLTGPARSGEFLLPRLPAAASGTRPIPARRGME